MKLRTLKRRRDARTAARAMLLARYPNLDWQWEECDWDEGDDDSEDGPACGHCGAGVNPHDEDECWHCGMDL